jgi:hypothetical protein
MDLCGLTSIILKIEPPCSAALVRKEWPEKPRIDARPARVCLDNEGDGLGGERGVLGSDPRVAVRSGG